MAREVGYATLCQEMARYGLSIGILDSRDMQKILNFFSLETVADLYRHIGDGRLRLPEIIHRFKIDLYAGNLPPLRLDDGKLLRDVTLDCLASGPRGANRRCICADVY